MFGDGDPFSDFFHTFFGGGAGAASARVVAAAPRRARQGRDVEQEIQLGLEDAYHGSTRRFSMVHDGHERTVDVRIPAGVADGSRVRVGGEVIRDRRRRGGRLVSPHPHGAAPRIRAQRPRSVHTLTIPLTTAVLGGEAEVRTISGKSLRLKVPPTTQQGQVFRLKGHGMPAIGKPDEQAISTRRSRSNCRAR